MQFSHLLSSIFIALPDILKINDLQFVTTCNFIVFSINTWLQKGAYVSKAIQLAHSFHINFDKFASQSSEEILNGVPLIDSHHGLEDHL